MADQAKIVLSAENLTTEYSVFERDQVLTPAQLNSLAEHFEVEGRLTRVSLFGVGVAAGLHVAVVGTNVTISKGIGITCDGDLLHFAKDVSYDSFKLVEPSSPSYAPFGAGDSLIPHWELLALGSTDVNKQPLSALPLPALPLALLDCVVVAYLESYEQDHDLCNVADCDNHGRVMRQTPRLLLVSRLDAPKLNAVLPTLGVAAQSLKWIAAERAKLGSGLDSTAKFASVYRASCKNLDEALRIELPTLNTALPEFTRAVFGADPSGEWIARLTQLNAEFATRELGIQYYYDFLHDVAETWNDLRAALLEDDSVLCPDFAAFPKHLLLGDLTNPDQLRTEFYPSPVVQGPRSARKRTEGLARKLAALIAAADFTAPPVVVTARVTVASDEPGKTETRNVLGSLRITPSRDEQSPLEARAIPVYYAQNPKHSMRLRWAPRGLLSDALRTPGYRWSEYHGSAAPDFFGRALGSYNVFRIEGHLGQAVNDVAYTLEKEIERQNLPIKLVSALLHNDRKKVVRRPPRYTDLHRLHYLFRKDVAAQLQFSRQDNSSFLKAAVLVAGVDTASVQRQHQQIEENIDSAAAPLANKRYSSYRQTLTSPNGNWKASYQQALKSVGSVKQSFADRVRPDYASPFDSVISSNQNLMVDWLDTLIDAREERADNKLLLTGLLADHPGLEHQASVPRGGTFVLVYDDKGVVVADLSLPYRVEESGEPEPDEPELTIPPHRAADLVDLGYKVLEPLDVRFTRELKNFETALEPKWMKEINIQQNYAKFFQDSLGSLGDVLNRGGSVKDFAVAIPATNDFFLDAQLADLQVTNSKIDKLRTQIASADTPKETLERLTAKLEESEASLGKLITDTTRYLVDAKTDVSSGKPAAGAVQLLGQSLVRVKGEKTVKSVTTEMGAISNAAPAGGKELVTRIGMGGGVLLRN